MIDLTRAVAPVELQPRLTRFWALSADKIEAIESRARRGSPVYTVGGRYTARGWTEWTQGFRYGSALLQYDATGERRFLDIGVAATLGRMTPHVTHTGVHDHGFNNVSTYGTLLRLMGEGRIADEPWQRAYCELALACSAAVQASRWTRLGDSAGYIHSFNGPHSLFADTIRSLRVLAIGHLLGHVLMGEGDRRIPLLGRLVAHADATARYNVYYGTGRDGYDVAGRVAHESIFNTTDGSYRCPSSQQGYSPFSTWTRGLAWVICGYAEQLEFVAALTDDELEPFGGRGRVTATMLRAARATADFYLESTPTCGVPYWDTGAPGLARLGGYLDRPADPFNDHEPVDSSAAAIAAQGLLRLAHYLSAGRGTTNGVSTSGPASSSTGGAAGNGSGAAASEGVRYLRAGLAIARTLFDEPYLSTDPGHEGVLLHCVYHWPNRWDHVPAGRNVACGESSMWGDYHARELALYVGRLASGGPYPTFFSANAGRDATDGAAEGATGSRGATRAGDSR